MIPTLILPRYKYNKFDEGSLSIIKDGTMKFTHPKHFNDPFDCHPEVDVEAMTKSTSEDDAFFKRMAIRLNLSPEQMDEEKPKLIENLARQFFSNFSEIINANIGICCLSRNPLNLLMWAHYANNHTGFVIEFSIPHISQSSWTSTEDIDSLNSFPVVYKKEKPIIVTGKASKSFKEYFLTKSIDWEYEQEERVIDFIRGEGIHPYNRKQILKSVIAGMRMSDGDFTELKNTVDNINKEHEMNVTVHKAEPVSGDFSLFVKNRDDLNTHNILETLARKKLTRSAFSDYF
ncbi:MAG: DUF2971 domain-containing protein [Methylococcaceae bacterium]